MSSETRLLLSRGPCGISPQRFIIRKQLLSSLQLTDLNSTEINAKKSIFHRKKIPTSSLFHFTNFYLWIYLFFVNKYLYIIVTFR
jgi:hypothetical protein